jgi:hypothetical protein
MTNDNELDEKNRRFVAEKVKKNYPAWLKSTSVSYNDLIINSLTEIKDTLNKSKTGIMLKYILFLSIIGDLGVLYKILVD